MKFKVNNKHFPTSKTTSTDICKYKIKILAVKTPAAPTAAVANQGADDKSNFLTF